MLEYGSKEGAAAPNGYSRAFHDPVLPADNEVIPRIVPPNRREIARFIPSSRASGEFYERPV
jgi:hypothetical protein